ncbi:MAG: hypothetical protein ACJAVK_003180 [Akkermansiaceae bacterium]|jgi:hypothetical protein
MRFALPVLLLLLAPIAAGALKYLPGNDSQPLIRRDLLPLDVDAIRDLAGHLATIADGPIPKSASQLRQRAQALTLSQRLQPAQIQAQAIENSFLNGNTRPRPDNEDIKPAKNAVIESADWLTQLPQDSEGHHLGQLLLDILHPIAPGAEVLKRRDVPNAQKRWEGIVAKVAQFEILGKVIRARPNDPAPQNIKKYAVTALLTEVPMFSKGLEEGAAALPGIVTTSLVITEATVPKPAEGETPSDRVSGSLRFQPETGFDVSPLYKALLNFFETNLDPLPVGYNLNINTNKHRYLPKNRENIAANIAMLLDAAVSGKSLRRNTLLFARLRADGTLAKPLHAWEIMIRLQELRPPAGTRIIVGSGMLEEMVGMLVLEKASFFTKYEVLEAATFKKARSLFYDTGKLPEELQSASDGYLEVRDKAVQANTLATFLSLIPVEERLIKASNFSSRHLSAKMLAKQAVRRPAYLTQYMFAQELNRLLEPLSNFEYVIAKTPDRTIMETYKNTRDSLDSLKRRLDRQELLRLDDAADLIKELNTIGRGASAIPENEEEIRKRDLHAFQKKLEDFRLDLRQIYAPVPEKDE